MPSASLDDLVQSIVMGFPAANHSYVEPSEQGLWNNQLGSTMALPPADPYSQFFSTDEFLARAVSGDVTSSWTQPDATVEGLGAFTFGAGGQAEFRPELFLPDHAPSYNVEAALADQQQESLEFPDFDAYSEFVTDSLTRAPTPPASELPAPVQPMASAQSQIQPPQGQQQQRYLPPAGASAARRRVAGAWAHPPPEFVVGSSSRPYGS